MHVIEAEGVGFEAADGRGEHKTITRFQLLRRIRTFLCGFGNPGVFHSHQTLRIVPHSPTPANEVLTETREANESSVRLTGQPDWFPLGEEVYKSSQIEEAQRKTLSFIRQPRWFLTDGAYPKSLWDVSTDAGGCRLELDIRKSDDPATLHFTITLTNTRRALSRQFEHRWNNVLPMLFAFYVDGIAISGSDSSFRKLGGVVWHETLLEPNESKRWSINVKADSILDLMPDHHAHSISIVAAFSEFQHEGGHSGTKKPKEVLPLDKDNEKTFEPPLVIRSEPANISISWDGKEWTMPANQ